MAVKSSQERYGTAALTIHWLIAVMIAAAIGAGFMASSSIDVTIKTVALRTHLLLGISVFLLTGIRAAWWLFADRKPRPLPGFAPLQVRFVSIVHALFYVVPVLMVASGVVMIATTNAAAILFGGVFGPLPQFGAAFGRVLHGAGARLLIALLILHVGSALYHQFVRRDGLVGRIWPRRN